MRTNLQRPLDSRTGTRVILEVEAILSTLISPELTEELEP